MNVTQVRRDILQDNKAQAQNIRNLLAKNGVTMINVMASPGAGKTSSILRIIETMPKDCSIAVIEADIDSMVDSIKVKDAGAVAVQINTGGSCHLEIPMLEPALDLIDLRSTDLIIVENIGNLVCTAEFDIGADANVMLLSVPEGDDKILKYPLMFSICDALVISKTDYLALPSNDFDPQRLTQRLAALNPEAQVFSTSAYENQGFEALCGYIRGIIAAKAPACNNR